MSYSEKFWPEGTPLDDPQAAALMRDALAPAGAGSAVAGDFAESGANARWAHVAVRLPQANPDSRAIYPEHVLIAAIWLASVAGALIQIF